MGRRTDCNSGAEESWRVGKEQETQEREPHRNICSRAPKAIDSQQMDTPKLYKTKRPGYMVTGCPDTKYPPCLTLFEY